MSARLIAPIRVMLVDDHEVVRRGLEMLLREDRQIHVAGSFTTSLELFTSLRQQTVDVLIVDYSLGPTEVDGINLIRALKVRFPDCRILVVSSHFNAATIALAMSAGAKGFVGKGQGHHEFLAAVRAVAAGRTYLNQEMGRNVKLGVDPGESTDGQLLTEYAKLSPREREVLRCYLDGMSVSQIAIKFSRSITTISAQKGSAFRKLGIRTDSELFKIRHQLGGA